jgi:hypothetical protein
MSESQNVSRRAFLNQSLAAAGAAGAAAGIGTQSGAQAATAESDPATASLAGAPERIPCGKIGNAKISRMLLGGNLVSGCMHARDLKYVSRLFRAYVTQEKMMETLKMAEERGINTVFETGANFIERYNRECGGHMQFIPHIRVDLGQSESSLREHIQKQVDTGAVALYVWGVSGDRLVQAEAVDQLAKAVELAKKHDLPVGVGGHSLLVPMACEKHKVPCDFYVKTLHSDDYPSATRKELRKEFIWLTGGEGWYDNMWCINPEETVEFMNTVTKPWLAFKVLAAGAFHPREGFAYAFKGGADFIAVGMFDFQIKQNCEQLRKEIRRAQDRERPWHA